MTRESDRCGCYVCMSACVCVSNSFCVCVCVCVCVPECESIGLCVYVGVCVCVCEGGTSSTDFKYEKAQCWNYMYHFIWKTIEGSTPLGSL